jgi:hypothetical protein
MEKKDISEPTNHKTGFGNFHPLDQTSILDIFASVIRPKRRTRKALSYRADSAPVCSRLCVVEALHSGVQAWSLLLQSPSYLQGFSFMIMACYRFMCQNTQSEDHEGC